MFSTTKKPFLSYRVTYQVTMLARNAYVNSCLTEANGGSEEITKWKVILSLKNKIKVIINVVLPGNMSRISLSIMFSATHQLENWWNNNRTYRMMSGENGRRVTIGLLQYVQKQSQYVLVFFPILCSPSFTTLFTLDTSSASSKHIMPMLSHTPRQ